MNHPADPLDQGPARFQAAGPDQAAAHIKAAAPNEAAAPSHADLASAWYVGTVRHRRHHPTQRSFTTRTYHALIDVDELPRLDREVAGFGHNRAALTSFHDRDHLGPLDLPVREKLRRWLAGQGATLPDGPLRVLTNLRVLGHVFNPVSWWYCYAPDGQLALVVAEVHNTFGDAHLYLLDDLVPRRDGTFVATADKRLHVSPFLPINDLRYRFVFRPPGERSLVHLDVEAAAGRVLDATQTGRRVALSSTSLRRLLLTHPVMPLRTVVLIHLHALALWWRRVPFHRRPTPPPHGLEHTVRPVPAAPRSQQPDPAATREEPTS